MPKFYGKPTFGKETPDVDTCCVVSVSGYIVWAEKASDIIVPFNDAKGQGK